MMIAYTSAVLPQIPAAIFLSDYLPFSLKHDLMMLTVDKCILYTVDPNIHWCVLNDIRQRILNKPYDSGATPKNARAIRDAFAEMEDIIDE